VKVHYIGSKVSTALLNNHALCDDVVRRIQNGHMDGNGWSDIGYSLLVCPHGFVFVGRGPHVLPAANGKNLNSGHYAICALLGSEGLVKPTDAMLNGIRDGIEYLRSTGSAGKEIKGHRDGYATKCPGDILYAWVRAGAPRIGNQSPEGDEMEPTTHVDVGETWADQFNKPHYQAGYLWVETLYRARQADANTDAILKSQETLTKNLAALTKTVNALAKTVNALQ